MKLKTALDTILSACMMVLGLQLLAMSCVGCGQQVQFSSIPLIDAELEPYVQRFRATYNIDVTFSVNFGTMDIPAHVGLCTTWSNGAHAVTIEKKFFESANDTQREVLLFHELGHCRLGKNHNDGTIAFTGTSGVWPVSIMNEYAFDQQQAQVYLAHKDYYIQQLWNEPSRCCGL